MSAIHFREGLVAVWQQVVPVRKNRNRRQPTARFGHAVHMVTTPLLWFMLLSIGWAQTTVRSPVPEAAPAAGVPSKDAAVKKLGASYRQQLLAKYGITDAILSKKPVQTPPEIRASVQKEIDAAVEKAYPPTMRETFLKEAKDKYPLYEIGDMIEMESTPGRWVKGVYRGMAGDAVVIGSSRIRASDVNPESFDAPLRKGQWDAYLLRKFITRRAQFAKQLAEGDGGKVATLYHENGYVRIGKTWMPAADAVLVVDAEVDDYERQVGEAVQADAK